MRTKTARSERIFFCYLLAAFILVALFAASAPNPAVASDSLAVAKITPDVSCLWSPGRLAIGNDGTLYVVDGYKNRVQLFDAAGRYLRSIAVARPSAVAVAPDGTVYIGSHKDYSVSYYKSGVPAGKLGAGTSEFKSVSDIVVDQASGAVYVADTAANVVKLYDSSGRSLQVLGGFHAPVAVALSRDAVYVLDAPVTAASGGSADTTGSRLTVLDKVGGMPIRTFADVQMVRPTGLAVDAFGNIFVSDASRKAVLVYGSEGVFVGTMTSPQGDLNTAVSVTLSRDGRLYVSSSETYSIVEVGLSGAVKAGSRGDIEFKSGSGDRITPVALGY